MRRAYSQRPNKVCFSLFVKSTLLTITFSSFESRRPNNTSPHGSDVAGKPFSFNTFNACGLNKAGSIRLLTKGALSASCRPALQAGEATVVQSPTSIAGVGMNDRDVVGAERWSEA